MARESCASYTLPGKVHEDRLKREEFKRSRVLLAAS